MGTITSLFTLTASCSVVPCIDIGIGFTLSTLIASCSVPCIGFTIGFMFIGFVGLGSVKKHVS